MLFLPLSIMLLCGLSAGFHPASINRFIDNGDNVMRLQPSTDLLKTSRQNIHARYSKVGQCADGILRTVADGIELCASDGLRSSVEHHDESKSNSDEKPIQVEIKPGVSTLYSDANNLTYLVDVVIAGDTYPLILDTASAFMWVYGEECLSPACQNRKRIATHNMIPEADSRFTLSYISGVVTGEIYRSHVIFNNMSSAKNFSFAVANEVPDMFDDYPMSGIFGLPSNKHPNLDCILSSLWKAGSIKEQKFAISLGHVDSDDEKLRLNTGVFSIGGPVEGLYKGDFYNVPVHSSAAGYWNVTVDALYVDESAVLIPRGNTSLNSYEQKSAIIDTGTTLMILPTSDAILLHSYFPNSMSDGKNFAIYCNCTSDLVVNLNNKNWTIPSTSYLGKEYPKDSGFEGYCVSNIQGSDIMSSWILGDIFLENVYVVFDLDNQQLSFAEKNHNVKLVRQDSSGEQSCPARSLTGSSPVSRNGALVNTNSSYMYAFVLSILMLLS
ncbi:HDL459Cp [Eremothecium sinecaudum]|uniref:HDL459Cp n=1 Tax=Eremothecium sinecaudum TaxID=45286 RepID=A0A0X8HRU8_9SACH|nr:HDL459Cp [Eremothecium sinecaudum]AMD20285.1 HDL459Cp [Eremothecium sinecaudum]